MSNFNFPALEGSRKSLAAGTEARQYLVGLMVEAIPALQEMGWEIPDVQIFLSQKKESWYWGYARGGLYASQKFPIPLVLAELFAGRAIVEPGCAIKVSSESFEKWVSLEKENKQKAAEEAAKKARTEAEERNVRRQAAKKALAEETGGRLCLVPGQEPDGNNFGFEDRFPGDKVKCQACGCVHPTPAMDDFPIWQIYGADGNIDRTCYLQVFLCPCGHETLVDVTVLPSSDLVGLSYETRSEREFYNFSTKQVVTLAERKEA